MDYSLIIELDNVTVDDCQNLFVRSKMTTILNDGRLINFIKYKGDSRNDNQRKKIKRKRSNTYKRK